MLDKYQPLILIIYYIAAIYTIIDFGKYRNQLSHEPFTVIILGGKVAQLNYFLYFGSVLPIFLVLLLDLFMFLSCLFYFSCERKNGLIQYKQLYLI